jgi:hypothetical protein
MILLASDRVRWRTGKKYTDLLLSYFAPRNEQMQDAGGNKTIIIKYKMVINSNLLKLFVGVQYYYINSRVYIDGHSHVYFSRGVSVDRCKLCFNSGNLTVSMRRTKYIFYENLANTATNNILISH